jgi:hypothetical protein
MRSHVRFAAATWIERAAARLTQPSRFCWNPVPVS